MLFNAALLTGLLLGVEALAVPSRLATRLARRRGGRQSQLYSGFDESTNTISSFDNPVWAGAILAQDNGAFQVVTGTFTVPTPSDTDTDTNSSWVSAAAWVGIDGYTCRSSLLQTGVDFTVDNGQVQYNAWHEWWPAGSHDFSGITISAGDVIQLMIVATSTTTGTARIDNLSNGQTVSENLTSTLPLCQQNAEWIVEDYVVNNKSVPFANFGSITFKNAVANGTGIHTPADAQIAEIEINGRVLTSVSTSESSVTIKYL